MQGRNAAQIAEAWCERNPSAACDRPVAPEPEDDETEPLTCED